MGLQTARDINIYIKIYDCVSASAVQKKKWERVRGKEGVRGCYKERDESVCVGAALGVCGFGVSSRRKGCVLVWCKSQSLFIKKTSTRRSVSGDLKVPEETYGVQKECLDSKGCLQN